MRGIAVMLIGGVLPWFVIRLLEYDTSVPSVVGKNRKEALRNLRSARLKVGKQIPEPLSDTDLVAEQKPTSGERVKRDTEIDLFYSIKPITETKPPVKPPPNPPMKLRQHRVQFIHPHQHQAANWYVDDRPALLIEQLPNYTTLVVPDGVHIVSAVTKDRECKKRVRIDRDSYEIAICTDE